jgi:hypothetical protein
MLRPGILMALALVAHGAAGVRAQDGTAASRPADVAVLIERLDSDDFATRQAATEQIALLGEAARPALLAAREAGSLERRLRIDQILKGLVARATSRPDRKVATLVTLHAAEKPLSEVSAMLTRASGYPIRISAGTDPVVTVALREVPFFQALDSLCAQTSRRADWDFKERLIVLNPSTEGPPPTVYAGPLRVALVMLTVNRQLWFGGKPQSSATLQIRIDAEEKTRALGVIVPLKPTELLDDRKRDLRDTKNQRFQGYLQRVDARRQLHAYMHVKAPETDAKTISRLEITVPMLVATESFEARFPSPEEGFEVVEGQFGAKIETWKPGPSQHDAMIAITRPALPPVAGSNAPVADDVVTFLAADGRPVQPLSTATNAIAGAAGVAMTFVLPAEPKVASIEVSSVKRVEILEVPVVFKDVPLP